METEPGPPRMLLRVPEVAKALSMGRSTLYEIIQRGELPVIRIGHSTRVRITDVETWLEQKARTGPKEADHV